MKEKLLNWLYGSILKSMILYVFFQVIFLLVFVILKINHETMSLTTLFLPLILGVIYTILAIALIAILESPKK